MRLSKVLWRGRALASWVSAISLVGFTAQAHAQIQGQVVAESVPSNSSPFPNELISVAINIDMRGVQAPDNRLNSYSASLAWNPAVIKFAGFTRASAPWNNPSIDTTNAVNGSLGWNDFRAGGVDPAKINVLNVNFKVIGAPGSSTVLDLSFSAMTNSLFRILLENLTVNDGTVTVQGGVEPLQCNVKITAPQANANICPTSVEVTGTIAVTGGVPPYNVACEVNGIAAVVTGSTFTATVPVAAGENSLIAKSTVIDSQGGQSICTDTVHVVRPAPPTVSVQITSPKDGALVCGDNVEVAGIVNVLGGLQPLSIVVDVNGSTANIVGTNFSATVPAGNGLLIATITVSDGCGNQSVSRDTVRVARPAPLACEVKIASPTAGQVVCANSVPVQGTHTVIGGVPPFIVKCEVNGVEAEVTGANFSAIVTLAPGVEFIVASCTIVDGCGQKTACFDTVQVKQSTPPVCEVQITSPKEGEFICGDTVTVTGTTNITGGFAPLSTACEVNGFPAEVLGNEFKAAIVLEPGVEFIVASCTVSDGCGSQSFCQDTIRVKRPAPPVCEVQITSPAEGALVCGDSVTVLGTHTISGGLPPYITECVVNGEPALVAGNTFSATIPLNPNVEFIIAVCTITDNCGSKSACRDTVRIQQLSSTATCNVQITSPANGAIVCDDTLTVTGSVSLLNGAPVIPIFASKVNGVPADMLGNVLTARVPLNSGDNLIVVTSTFEDNCGNTATCSDSITVFRDDIVPACTFKLNGTVITGSFTDSESGMARIKPVKLKNAALTVTPFDAGDRKVRFRLDAIDPAKPMGFSIDGFDVCGNKVNCDPVALTLSTDGSRQHSFTFPSMDRYLQVNNHGLREIRIVLNEKRFALFSEANQAGNEINAYRMPFEGAVTIDLHPYLRAGETENDIFIAFDGEAGTGAEFLLMDVVQQVDHILDLQTIPEAFHLAQNYPNPFNPSTTIRFDVPDTQSGGVHVQLRVYNLLGELVRTLVDETKLAGQHLALWDGRNEQSEVVSTGIYIYRITAGNFSETRRMTLQK
jgi:hypothetical protein